MTINVEVARFQATKCEDAFRYIYNYIYDEDRNIVKKLSQRYKIDEHDVESMINDRILTSVNNFDSSRGSFRNVVSYSIKNGCIDILRKSRQEETRRTEVMYEDDDGTSHELYEVIEVAPTTNEDDIFEEIQKKHDQRQLIEFLIGKADELTLTSASAFVRCNSYRQAAKLIGTTHVTVRSRIRKLAKQYDKKRFGDYLDYFTEPTEYVG